MTYPGRDNAEAMEQFMGRLAREFGESAEAIVRVMAEELGGCRVRIPRLVDLERMQRDRLIRLRFNGRNHQELALRFDLSVQQVYNILRVGAKK